MPGRPGLLVLVLSMILLPVSACHRETKEDKVREVIESVRKSVEEKEIMTVLGHVSKTYRDPRGHDYEGVQELLVYYLYRHRKVSVSIPDIEVEVKGAEATARFLAILAARGGDEGPANFVLPDALGAYKFDVTLALEKGGWKITSATWIRAEETGEGR